MTLGSSWTTVATPGAQPIVSARPKSLSVGSKAAASEVEHIGLVVSGRAAVTMADGHEFVIGSGDFLQRPRAATTAG